MNGAINSNHRHNILPKQQQPFNFFNAVNLNQDFVLYSAFKSRDVGMPSSPYYVAGFCSNSSHTSCYGVSYPSTQLPGSVSVSVYLLSFPHPSILLMPTSLQVQCSGSRLSLGGIKAILGPPLLFILHTNRRLLLVCSPGQQHPKKDDFPDA